MRGIKEVVWAWSGSTLLKNWRFLNLRGRWDHTICPVGTLHIWVGESFLTIVSAQFALQTSCMRSNETSEVLLGQEFPGRRLDYHLEIGWVESRQDDGYLVMTCWNVHFCCGIVPFEFIRAWRARSLGQSCTRRVTVSGKKWKRRQVWSKKIRALEAGCVRSWTAMLDARDSLGSIPRIVGSRQTLSTP